MLATFPAISIEAKCRPARSAMDGLSSLLISRKLFDGLLEHGLNLSRPLINPGA